MRSFSHVPYIAVDAPYEQAGVYQHPHTAGFDSSVAFPRAANTVCTSYRGNHNIIDHSRVESHPRREYPGNDSRLFRKQNRSHKKQHATKRQKKKKKKKNQKAGPIPRAGNSRRNHHQQRTTSQVYARQPRDQYGVQSYQNQNQYVPTSPPLPPCSVRASHQHSHTARKPYVPSSPTYCDDTPVADYAHYYSNSGNRYATTSTNFDSYGVGSVGGDVVSPPCSDTSSDFHENMAELRVMYKKFAEKHRLTNRVDFSATPTASTEQATYDPQQPQHSTNNNDLNPFRDTKKKHEYNPLFPSMLD